MDSFRERQDLPYNSFFSSSRDEPFVVDFFSVECRKLDPCSPRLSIRTRKKNPGNASFSDDLEVRAGKNRRCQIGTLSRDPYTIAIDPCHCEGRLVPLIIQVTRLTCLK